jgi:hypothetical protein
MHELLSMLYLAVAFLKMVMCCCVPGQNCGAGCRAFSGNLIVQEDLLQGEACWKPSVVWYGITLQLLRGLHLLGCRHITDSNDWYSHVCLAFRDCIVLWLSVNVVDLVFIDPSFRPLIALRTWHIGTRSRMQIADAAAAVRMACWHQCS